MIGQVLALIGAVLVLFAGLGVLRFDDVFARMHALTKGSTLGIVLVLIGAAIYLDRPNDWTSLLLAAAAQLLTSPIASNLLGRSTYLLQRAREQDSDDGRATEIGQAPARGQGSDDGHDVIARDESGPGGPAVR